MMDEYLLEYARTFKKNFPIMLLRGMGDEEIIDIIKGCLENKTAYKPVYEDGAVY